MVELTCVACGAKENVLDKPTELRAQTCHKCGQPLVLFRQPGSMPHVPAHA